MRTPFAVLPSPLAVVPPRVGYVPSSLTTYRDGKKEMQILLSRTQAGPGRTFKQEQEQTSRYHVQASYPSL